MVYVLTLNNTFDWVQSTIIIGVFSTEEKAEKEIELREKIAHKIPQDPPINVGWIYYIGSKEIRERQEEWYEIEPMEIDKGESNG